MTGASVGMGAATARDLARRRFHVLAGVRRESDADAIRGAGIAANAPVEVLPLSERRRSFEVNLFGHVAVTQAFLPALLRDKGRIVNISSVGGKVAMAGYGAYAGSKFALEAMSDASAGSGATRRTGDRGRARRRQDRDVRSRHRHCPPAGRPDDPGSTNATGR
ncbi:SDR family NAD(P)-dependent oxidoreductase [Actinoplanes sp. NPDC051343]|uniref:SDR family NAD(P)-dependent oxidoreductase n=1 Tax=Actinoplanes sp. NPDC051343 TaxID=3363906 RepID=UPI0037A43F5D